MENLTPNPLSQGEGRSGGINRQLSKDEAGNINRPSRTEIFSYEEMKNGRHDITTKTNVWLTVLMLLAVGVMTVVVSLLFPREGVRAGAMTLRFADVRDYLPQSESDSLSVEEVSPEQLLAERMEQMKMERAAEFLDFFENNPARISFPKSSRVVYDTTYLPLPDNEAADAESYDSLQMVVRDTVVTEVNYAYLDEFFRSLENAGQEAVRVVHYGDSQIEEDRISGTLRRCLQERFGGGGVGLLPYKNTFYNLTVSEQMHGSYTRYSLISYDRDAERTGTLFGPLLQASVPNGKTSLHIFPRRGVPPCSAHYFNRVTVLTGRSELQVSVADTAFRTAGKLFEMTTVTVPDSTTTVDISITGGGDVYGVSLETDKGVTVDNIPLRGCSGSVFVNLSKEQLREYFARTNTRLIILEFGGNSIPALTSEKAVEYYVNRLVTNALLLSNLAPKARLLFVGPSDMVQSSLQGMRTHPYLKKFDTLARERLTESGIAYWSMFEAMGGEGSMQRWATGSPRLAAADYIHFTRTGAREVARMLDEAIMTAYRYYQLRQINTSMSGEMPLASVADDSLDIDSIARQRLKSMMGE